VPDLLESLLELQEGRGGPPRAYEPAAASRASNARLRADRRGGSGSGGGGGGEADAAQQHPARLLERDAARRRVAVPGRSMLRC